MADNDNDLLINTGTKTFNTNTIIIDVLCIFYNYKMWRMTHGPVWRTVCALRGVFSIFVVSYNNIYRELSSIGRTKSQNVDVCRLVFQLSNAIYWSKVYSREWSCSWSSTDTSNYIWVINNFIVYQGAAYVRCFTVRYILYDITSQWMTTNRLSSHIDSLSLSLYLHTSDDITVDFPIYYWTWGCINGHVNVLYNSLEI